MNDPAGPSNPTTALPGIETQPASIEPPAAENPGVPARPNGGPSPLSAPSAQPPTPAEAAVLELERARRRDKRIGMGVVAGAFVVGLGISFWAKIASRPETSDPPGPPTKEGVVGYPEHVDVVATLEAARKLTKRTLLRGISVEGVRSDGTIDLGEGPGRARYAFQSPAGQGPQPVTEAGTSYRQPFCGRQDVHLRREGIVADTDRASVPCVSMKSNDGLPDPQCSLATIWQRALSRGAPSDKLARIEYFRAHGGPAWRFEMAEGSHRFVLYGDCRRELKGGQAAGHVP